MTTTLKLGGKELSAITTWERFASACVENQVWVNPVWPEFVEAAAITLAEEQGFVLFTWRFKEGLHGTERVRKYARRPQEFWVGFAKELGFEWKTDDM
jgi:hypothetical protein